MSKKKKQEIVKVLPQEEIQKFLDATATKIAELLAKFIRRTGQIIGEIVLSNQGQWDGDTLKNINQVVTLKCGLPQKPPQADPPGIKLERTE